MSQDQMLKDFVRIAGSPQASAQERNDALRVCEAWKQDISNLPAAMNLLSSGEKDLSLVLFAFNAVEYMLKFLYESIPEDQKQALKESLSSKLVSPQGMTRMYREKLSGLIVELAIREWPQRWPNLLELILAVQDLDFATMVLWDFINTIHYRSTDESYWDGERKSELQSALAACVQPISSWLLHGIQGHPTSYTRVFILLCSWGHFEYSTFKRLITIIVKEFQRGNVEAQVFADFLNQIGKRSLTADFEETPLLIFSKDLEARIAMYLKEDYGVFRNLLEAYLNCASEFYANSKKSDLLKQQGYLIEQVYEFACQHVTLPSFLVKASCHSYISTFTSTDKQVAQSVSGMLDILTLDTKVFYKSEYNEEDFDDDMEEFKSGVHALQAVVCDYFRNQGCKHPEAMLRQLLSVPIMTLPVAKALLTAIDHSLRNLRTNIPQDVLMALYQQLVGLSKNQETIYECLSALTTFAIYITKNYPAQPITDFVAFMFSVAGAPEGTIDIKCRAFSSILKLVSAAPARFVDNVADLVSLGQFAKGQRELRLYVELVLVLAASEHFSANKYDLLNCIITPLLAQLDAFPIMSEEEFLEKSGMRQLSTGVAAPLSAESSLFRNNVGNCLTLIQTCSKRLIDVDVKGVESALQPVIEKFFAYVCSFFGLLVNVQYWPQWNQRLSFELFVNDYSAAEEDEEQEAAPYFNRWHAHLTQICAMAFSYLQKCAFTGKLFSTEFNNFSTLFERIQRPNTKTIVLKYLFEPLQSNNRLNWTDFLNRLSKFRPRDDVPSPAYEAAAHGYLNQLGSFLSTIFVTTVSLHQKVDSTIDLDKGSIIEPPSALRSELLLGNAELVKFMIELLEWRQSALSTKIATILFHHFATLVQRGPEVMKEVFLVMMPTKLLPLLDQVDLQGLYIALIGESFKWLLYYNQSHLIHQLLQLPTEQINALIGKLQSSSSIKSQRSELRKCLTPYLISKKAAGGGVVKKLPEKLVIMQKLMKQKEESQDVDVSALFTL